MMRSTPILLAVLILCVPSLAIGGVSKDIAKKAERSFNETPRPVRAGHLLLPVNYVEWNGSSYGYTLPRRFVRLAKEGDVFRIKKTHYKKRFLRLELESGRKAKVTLFVYDQDKLSQEFLDEVFPRVLRDLFEFGDALPGARLVGNARSKKIHLRGCNHLPPMEARVELATHEEGESRGFTRCSACFSSDRTLPIENYAARRRAAVEEARLFELAFPAVKDEAAQMEIQSLGESIVEDFPIETAGFDYRFRIVEAESPMAMSYWSGFVFVSDKLMEMIEEPEELEFILAHEIAHVERPDPPHTRIGVLPEEISHHFRMQQRQETESDLLALAYLQERIPLESALDRARSILAKLQFAEEALPLETSAEYATHPPLSSRVARFMPGRFLTPDTPRVFCGIDKEGESLVRLRLLGMGQESDMSPTWAYMMVEATDLLNKPAKLFGSRDGTARGHFRDAQGKKRLLLSDWREFTVRPGQSMVVPLIIGKKKLSSRLEFNQVDLTDVTDLEMKAFSKVEKWVECER